MNSVIIRPAGHNDLQEWSRMHEALWPGATAAAHLAELEAFFPNPKFKGFLAEAEGKLAGFAEAYLRDFANGCEARPVVFLEGIWVREDLRRQGIARRFVEAVELWARDMGIPEIGSDALSDNALSHSVHLKWGFEEMERVVHFRKKLG